MLRRWRKHSVRRRGRLLPPESYGGLDEGARDRVDAVLRAQLHTIPTRPGVYLDREGDPWTLDNKGRWADRMGERRGAAYTPLMSAFGPFTGPEEADG